MSPFGASRAAGPKENDEDVPFGQSRLQVAASDFMQNSDGSLLRSDDALESCLR